ncbi:MAG TPA: hypothetical protein DIT62_03140 [Alphaproteobacteria bacterium]|nr:hypothetical protein [Alphaproteobacteria bacterium]|tara:strand:+ start:1901 stop:2455 length:555 start_codon:yes stop_codon:yes gene_type:complete
MRGLIILAFIIVLIWVEVIVFGMVADTINVLPTIIGVFATAIMGFQLMRYRFMQILAGGGIAKPPHEIMPLVLPVLFGGFGLIIPGYASDAFGVLCFLPIIRDLLGVTLFHLFPAARTRPFPFQGGGFSAHMNMSGFGYPDQDRDPQSDDSDKLASDMPSNMIVEGEAEHIDPDDKHDKNEPNK